MTVCANRDDDPGLLYVLLGSQRPRGVRVRDSGRRRTQGTGGRRMSELSVTSERVGDSILITAAACRKEITLVLDLAQATRLGTVLLAQACNDDDGLELPEAFRDVERES